MSAAELANQSFNTMLTEARKTGLDPDAVCRALLGLVVTNYLERRSVSDVQSELQFLTDNCDPDADFAFMRP